MRDRVEEEYELVEALSRGLVHDFNLRRWAPHHRVLSTFRTPSTKLVYLLLATYGPLGFTSIRRILSVSRHTVDKALKELMASECIVLDELYLYSVNYFALLDQERLSRH